MERREKGNGEGMTTQGKCGVGRTFFLAASLLVFLFVVVDLAEGEGAETRTRSRGCLISWGADTMARCEDGTRPQVSGTPEGEEYVAVSAGLWFSLALKNDGTLVAWGSDQPAPVVKTTPKEGAFQSIACGGFHAVALDEEGGVVCWGGKQRGQRNGVPEEKGFVAVAAGGYHSMEIGRAHV